MVSDGELLLALGCLGKLSSRGKSNTFVSGYGNQLTRGTATYRADPSGLNLSYRERPEARENHTVSRCQGLLDTTKDSVQCSFALCP